MPPLLPLPANAPDFGTVASAAFRNGPHAHRTPILTSRLIDRELGARVYFKAENLQRAGAFKFRGACSALTALTPEERRRGVVAYSSGNHAQALALAGSILGVRVVVVMPADAPAVKITATREYGAEVVLYDRLTQSREEVAGALEKDQGLTLVPPFDHPEVIAGQGTAALELFEEVGPLEALFVCVGGGGLISGCGLGARQMAPDCRVIGVEPATGDDAGRSFRSGTLQRNENPATVADGARTTALGKLTFPLVQRVVDEFLAVDDGELCRALFHAMERLKVVLEPTGALGVAGLLQQAGVWRKRRVGVILSGGNLDFTAMPTLLRLAGRGG